MKLTITRHGETEENKNHILTGHLPGILSPLGIQQAQKLADRLKDEHFDYIYSSDLNRAADTAKAISVYHPDISIEYTALLREKDIGSYTGKPWTSCDWHNPPDEFESEESCIQRAGQVLTKAYIHHPNDSVLVVAHDGINNCLLQNFMPKNKIPDFKNTSLTIIEYTPTNYDIELMNCMAHLK